MLTLVYLRLLHSGSEFYIGSNMAAAGLFDDIVVKYRADSEQPWSTAMLQLLKHKKNTVVGESALLSLNNDFSLVKYCASYCQMKSSKDGDLEFLSEFSNLQFIMFTNSILEVQENIIKKEAENTIFGTGGTAVSFVPESQVFHQLCEWSDFKSIVLQLKDQAKGNSEKDVKNTILKIFSRSLIFTNKSVHSTIDELLNKPKMTKLEEMMQKLHSVHDKKSNAEFLSNLQFYTSQNVGGNIDKIIKKYIRNDSFEADAILHELMGKLKSWCEKENTYLTQDSSIWLDIIRAHAIKLSESKLKELEAHKIEFKDTSVDNLHREIPWTSGGILNVIVDSRTTASLIKVMAALERFEDKENILFVDMTTLLHREDEVIGLWSSRWCRILVVECDTELGKRDIGRLSNKIINVVEGKLKNKLLVLIGRKSNGLTETLDNLNGYKCHRDSCKWSDLIEDSREHLIGIKVELQGKKISLKTLLGKNEDRFSEKVNGDVISQLLRGDTRCGKVIEPVGDNFIPRRLRASDGKEFDVNSVSDVNEKVVLIVAEPGMGKSTLVTHLAHSAKAADPTTWVVHVKLNDCTQHLATMDLENVFPSTAKKILELLSFNSENSLEKALFRSFTQNLLVFVDGGDEMYPHFEERALAFLRCLNDLKFNQLWVTSCSIMQPKLVSLFEVQAFRLEPFSLEDQFGFLMGAWKEKLLHSSDKKTKIKIQRLLKNIMENLRDNHRLLEVPLMASIIAEVLDHQTFNTKLDKMEFYNTFTEKKLGLSSFTENKRKYLIKNHQLAGLKYCFDDEIIFTLQLQGKTDLMTSLADFLQDLRNEKVKSHFIDDICADGTPRFVHRTFAEYFVASWLADNFENNRKFMKQIVSCPSCFWIRDMFNRILAKDLPILTAILNDDVDDVDMLLKSKSSAAYSAVDRGGRTPLHLAVLLSCAEHGLRILWLLLQHNARVDVADNVLGWRPLQYADRVQAWSAAGMILAEGGNEDDMPTIMSIKQPTRKAFIEFIKQPLTTAPDVSLMLAAARDAGLSVVRYLVEERRGDVQWRGSSDETMLHMAAEGGDVELLEYLYTMETPLHDKDSDHATALKYAALNSSTDAIRFLLEASSVHGNLRQTQRIAVNWADMKSVNKTSEERLVCLVKEGDEHVVGIRDGDGRVSALQLGLFRVPVDNPGSFAKIVKQGSEYLYIHDEYGFIGYGHFTANTYLKELAVSRIDHAKEAILKCFQIDGLKDDSLSASRDTILKQWKCQMEKAVATRNYDYIKEINLMLKMFMPGSDIKLLEYINTDSSLPVELKSVSKQLFDMEGKFTDRNTTLGCLSSTLFGALSLSGLPLFLREQHDAAIEIHMKMLAGLVNETGRLADQMKQSLSSLKGNLKVLLINRKDIELFNSLEPAAKRFRVGDQLDGILYNMWDTFVKSTTKIETPQELTTPVYQYLFISFLETVADLSSRTKRTMFNNPNAHYADQYGLLTLTAYKWKLNHIGWPADAPIQDLAREEESRFLIHMMEHVSPGNKLTVEVIHKCTSCNPNSEGFLKKIYKRIQGKVKGKGKIISKGDDVPIEPLIWTTVLRKILNFLLTNSRLEMTEYIYNDYEKLLTSLGVAHEKYVTSCASSESCRAIGRNIAEFAAEMFNRMKNLRQKCDTLVLLGQCDFMSSMMDFQKHGTQFSEYLPTLIAEFLRYWDTRIGFDTAVSSNFTHSTFIEEIQGICNDLHATLYDVLKTELAPDVILDYLRLFNEFLTTFQHINFVWLVQIDPAWDGDLGSSHRKMVTGKKNTSFYEVTDQKAFVAELVAANVTVPKHYVLAIARRLTDLVSRSLVHGAFNEGTRVRGTGNLLEAIRKAFIHLDDQIDYQSFEQFEKDICQPFESVAAKMNQYADFKHHLDNLEIFFVYSRKQNEIEIVKALGIFQDKAGNTGTINPGVLKECFMAYDKAFELNIFKHYNEGVDILQTIKSSFPVKDHSQWDTEFRRQRIPELLAAVSAFWSIRESVHVIDTGNSIKPHCIQILCVLRLLNVDQDCRSLRKHLAEVLTGQGKSLVLGLLASVLALTGHSVQIVCYSKYLAERDRQAFEEFFGALGISDKVNYGTFDNLADSVLYINMNGSVHFIRHVLQKMVLDELPASSYVGETDGIQRPTILLIDEVDVFFTDDFYGNTYGMCMNTAMPALLEIQEEIWKMVCKKQDAKSVTTEIQELATKIFVENSDTKFSQFYEKTKIWFQKQLGKMIDDAFSVHDQKAIKNAFKINENGEITHIRSDGLYNKNSFCRYENIFSYLRLKQDNFDHKNYHNYGYLFIQCGHVSYAELPKEYPVILGVSGTISTLSGEEMAVVRDSYGIEDVSCMPTFFGKVSQVFFPSNNFQIADDEKKWQYAILQSVREKMKLRAVIVFFNTELEIDQFTERFKNDLSRFTKLTGNEGSAQMERSIKDAGVAGSLTLAIRAMGRGVDYRSSLTVEQNGGVHVVQTFLSLDVKEETQIKGRTARKDNKGSYELILCRQHLIAEGFLTSEDGVINYETLHGRRLAKAAEKYKRNGENVRKALEKHNLSLELIKSFATYHPDKRSGYFTKYPFVDV